MATRTSRFAFDWWIIQKRFLYLVAAILLLCGVAGGAALYVWKYGNPLRDVAKVKTASGARFVSFEGDVRVIRAATREIISATSDTELYPGDTVQTQASGRARIGLADGSTLLVTSVGASFLSGPFYLNDVLVAPGLTHPLLSVCRLTSNNHCSMEFDP